MVALSFVLCKNKVGNNSGWLCGIRWVAVILLIRLACMLRTLLQVRSYQLDCRLACKMDYILKSVPGALASPRVWPPVVAGSSRLGWALLHESICWAVLPEAAP